MNTFLKTSFIIAASAISFVSCQKETEFDKTTEQSTGKEVVLTIKAGAPETKTSISGTTPSWSENDKISVVYKQEGKSSWYKKASDALKANEAGEEATFSVSLTDPDESKDAYAYYPSNGYAASADAVKVTISKSQEPTSGSFDGASDILISKPFTPSGTVSTQFKRLGAVLKIKLDNSTINSEKLKSISLTAETNLVGDVQVTLSSATPTGIVDNENASATVTATYSTSKQFVISADGAYAYLIVYPQTLAAGSTLTVSGETSNYAFSRTITIPAITLTAGHITPLNIPLAAKHLTELPGDPLPFNGNLSTWQTSTSTNGTELSSIATDSEGLFVEQSKSFDTPTSGEIRLGTGKAIGYITTKDLDLSGAFKVVITAKCYGSDSDVTLKTTVNGNEVSKTLTDSFEEYEYSYAAGKGTTKSPVVISTIASSKRAIINAIDVVVDIPKLNAPTSVEAEAVDDDIVVSWVDASGADKYLVTCTGEDSQEINPGVQEATFPNLNDGIYTVTVTSISNDHSVALDADAVTIKDIVVGTVSMDAPENADVDQAANGFTASWDAVSSPVDAESYEWDLATDSEFSTIVATGSSDSNELTAAFDDDGIAWEITKFTVGQTYYFRVKALATNLTASAFSTAASFVAAATPGTADNPYSVSAAISKCKTLGNNGTQTGVYVTGIVSKVNNYDSTNECVTYWLSDDGTYSNDKDVDFQVYRGKGINGADVTSNGVVEVGDIVTVTGTMKYYNGTTSEFDAGSSILSLTRKTKAPSFNPEEGTYYITQNVVLESETEGATIYYTTNGDDPTTSSNVYSTPIEVSTTTTIKAFATKSGLTNSDIVSATITIAQSTPLAAPENLTCANATKTYNKLVFTWDAVTNASNGYEYSINGGSTWTSVNALTYSWEGLDANKAYTFMVRAKGTTNGQYSTSPASSLAATTDAIPTLTSISISGTATKTEYTTNDKTISLAGLTVSAHYDLNKYDVADVTASCTVTNAAEVLGSTGVNKDVIVSYTDEFDNTQTATFKVTVTEPATSVTFTFGTSPSSYTSGSSTITEGVITITGAKGTNSSTAARAWSDGFRIYAGNTVTFSAENGYVITKIEGYSTFNFTGSQQSVQFTGLSKATCGSDITVTYEATE